MHAEKPGKLAPRQRSIVAAPPAISRRDILPAVKRDPNYLREKHMRVIDYHGNPVDQAGIDWSRYSGSDFPYLMRQEPGPENALGRIKFMFPNKHAVYLHDTPSKELFARTQRAFSSGCIRIEDPYGFVALLLDDDPYWNRERVIAAVDDLKTRTIRLRKPVTVILLYWTVDVGEDGAVLYKQDSYDRDPPIIKALG